MQREREIERQRELCKKIYAASAKNNKYFAKFLCENFDFQGATGFSRAVINNRSHSPRRDCYTPMRVI